MRKLVGALFAIYIALPSAFAEDPVFEKVRQTASVDCQKYRAAIGRAFGASENGRDVRTTLLNLDYDPVVVICAMIDQESNGRIQAPRYEPEFCRTYVQSDRREMEEVEQFETDFAYPSTREALRDYCASHGPLQVMYTTAQLTGFNGSAKELASTEINVRVGVNALAKVLEVALKIHSEPREQFLWMLRNWNGGERNRRTLTYALSVENIYEDMKKKQQEMAVSRR